MLPGFPPLSFLDPLPFIPETKEAHAGAGLDVEKGSFVRQSGTGNQTITLTDSGLTPKAVIFFGTLQTADGFTGNQSEFFGYMVNATQQRAYANGQVDTDKGGFSKAQVKAILIIDEDGVIEGAADWVSFSAGEFVIDWTTNDGVASIIHYIALGGDSLANVEVGDFTINTSTGNQAVVLAGAFQPKLVLFMGVDDITSYPQSIGAGSSFYGMAKSSTERGGMAGDNKADKTSTTQRTDRAISITTGGGALSGDADFVSMNSDGFTINITDAPVVASKVAYIAFGGTNLNVEVGSFNQPTSTGIQTITTTNQPKIVWLQSFGKVTSTSVAIPTRHAWGAATASTEEGSISLSMDDSKNNKAGTFTTKVIHLIEANGTSNPTVKAEADFDSFNATDFKLNWTTVDATAREVLYWTLGAPATLATAGTALTQPTNVDEGDTAVVIGAFTFIASPASVTVTSIKINEEGTVIADSKLTNVKLYSQQEATCTFAGSSQLGSTQTFDSSDEATFGSLSLSVGTGTQQCVFVVADVSASAGGANTIEIELTAVGDVLSSGDSGITGTFPVQISGSTNIRADSGTIMSPEMDFDWVSGDPTWGEAIWSTTESQGDVKLSVYYTVSTPCDTIVPDGTLSNNAAGFDVSASPLDISGLTPVASTINMNIAILSRGRSRRTRGNSAPRCKSIARMDVKFYTIINHKRGTVRRKEQITRGIVIIVVLKIILHEAAIVLISNRKSIVIQIHARIDRTIGHIHAVRLIGTCRINRDSIVRTRTHT